MIKLIRAYAFTIFALYKNDSKNSLTVFIYGLLLISLFVFTPRAHAAIDPTTPILSYRHVNGDYFLNADMVFQKYTNEEFCGADFFSDPNYFYNTRLCDRTTGEETRTWINANSSYFYSGYHTAQQCIDSGYLLLQVPTGFTHEGSYICSPLKGFGFGLNGSTNPDNPSDGIYTPEKFDEFFCGQPQIKDKLTYAYYPLSSAIDYRVRRALSSSAVLGGDPNDETLNIYICGSDGCSYEQLLEDARKVISFLPEERFFAKESQYGGYYDFEVFAYCKSAVKQISISDLTSDPTVDCRKAIYQYTGESGASLTSPPDNFCYEDNEHDYSFKQWCEGQFSQDSYWLEGQLEEYCDPPAKTTSEEKVETSDTCEITTEIIDVAYNTDETRNDITKNIQKKIITKDCEGNVLDETVVDGSITIDKSEILGDGSSDGSERECVVGPYCPPNNGTSEGTGSGKGEVEAGSDIGESVDKIDVSESWYDPKYTTFSDLMNKHLDELNTGPFGTFLASLNPFGDTADFPLLKFDFSIPQLGIDFGTHSIDLENIPWGNDKTINIILLLKALLLTYTSIYAFKQVF